MAAKVYLVENKEFKQKNQQAIRVCGRTLCVN
jgi:hypothetical protein